MRTLRSIAVRWMPVLIWMCLIFSGSGDQASFQHSSGLLRPLLVWLFPSLSDEGFENTVFVIRKIAHVFEYAVLSMLLWRALRRARLGQEMSWEWSRVLSAFGLAVAYAVTDELHQLAVPTRQGSPIDVLIDSLGAGLGLAVIYLVGRWRHWWHPTGESQVFSAAALPAQKEPLKEAKTATEKRLYTSN